MCILITDQVILGLEKVGMVQCRHGKVYTDRMIVGVEEVGMVQCKHGKVYTDCMIIGVEEVGMVWKPADAENYQHNYEHLGQLKLEILSSN